MSCAQLPKRATPSIAMLARAGLMMLAAGCGTAWSAATPVQEQPVALTAPAATLMTLPPAKVPATSRSTGNDPELNAVVAKAVGNDGGGDKVPGSEGSGNGVGTSPPPPEAAIPPSLPVSNSGGEHDGEVEHPFKPHSWSATTWVILIGVLSFLFVLLPIICCIFRSAKCVVFLLELVVKVIMCPVKLICSSCCKSTSEEEKEKKEDLVKK